MRRREFVTLIGGTALTWPVSLRAQQAVPIVGILHEGLPAPLSLTTAFLQGLIEGGFSQGSNAKSKIVGRRENMISYRHWRQI
jgi:putative ABC transport system substrate-binding protein